jgi:predicted enzyme related to lactoylglutathione lyase
MNNISYFEIQSTNPAREAKFYSAVFGWEFTLDPAIPIEYYRIESGNLNGGLLKRPTATPPTHQGTNAFTNSMEVKSFDETAKIILANGGAIAMPKFPVPGKCWQGYFLDPDNNVFGIFEVDLNAK